MPLPDGLRKTLSWVTETVAHVPPEPGYRGASSMLIDDGDVVLVDAGLAPSQRRALSQHVDVCILTHCHAAHVAGASEFREVWAPRAEAKALRSAEDFCEVAGVPSRERTAVVRFLEESGYRPANVKKTYLPGGVLKLDTTEWRLIPAPGHSPGLTLLLDPKAHVLFAADLDGADPWYGWPHSDLDDFERTATELAKVDVAVLLGSHSPPRKRQIRQMFRGLAARIGERDKKVLAALREPRTLDEVVQLAPVTGRIPQSPMDAFFERTMTEKHVLRLLAKEFVSARQDGRYVRLV